jgi:cytochrome c oxidase subunit 2
MNGFILLAEGAISTHDLSIFHPASPPAESIRSLYLLVLVVAAAIFLLVEGVLLYSIVRFRRSPPDGQEPPQVYGSMPIEIAWTVAPMLIVLLLALILTRTELPRPMPRMDRLFEVVDGRHVLPLLGTRSLPSRS